MLAQLTLIEPKPFSSPIAESMKDLFESGSFNHLFRTTIFSAGGMSQGNIQGYRFAHRTLFETALARFAAFLYSAADFKKLHRRTFDVSIFELIDFYFRGTDTYDATLAQFDSKIIDIYLKETKDRRNQFIYGKLAALLSFWNPVVHDYRSAQRFVGSLSEIAACEQDQGFQTAPALHVALSSFVVISFNDSADGGINSFRLAIKEQIANNEQSTEYVKNLITSSLIECVRYIYADQLIDLVPKIGEDALAHALELSTAKTGDELDDLRTHSMRVAYAQSLRFSLEDSRRLANAPLNHLRPRRLVTRIHYGLMAAATVKSDPRSLEVERELLSVLDYNENGAWLSLLDDLEPWQRLIDDGDSPNVRHRLLQLNGRLHHMLELSRAWVRGT